MDLNKIKKINLLLISFFVVFINNSLAETRSKKGFESGIKSFSNPFANDIELEGGEEKSDSYEKRDRPTSRRDSRKRSSSSPPADVNKEVPDPMQGTEGIEVGGGSPSGVKVGNRVGALNIALDTGEGSDAIISDFNYPDVDIMDLAKTMGKLTGKNFIFDKDVRGRVTIVSNSPITVSDAWRAFLTALDMNSFTLIPSGKYIRIARTRDARDKPLRTYTGKDAPDTDLLITRIFPLKHISASELARTFRSFMPANSRVYPHEETNTLIVTDIGSNLAKLERILDFLDIEGHDLSIEVIPIRYASAGDLAGLIDTLIPGTKTEKKGKGSARTFGSSSGFKSRRTKEGGVIDAVIADERTNNLIILSNAKGLVEINKLVYKLDRKMSADSGVGKIHVVYLQFADAEEISKTLNALGSQTKKSKSKKSKLGIGENPRHTALFEGSIKVSADKSTNSLVITASPSDFETIERVIGKLDIPRDQVYVEVIIMEMAITRDHTFSVNTILPTAPGIGLMTNTDLIDFLSSPLSQKGAVMGFASGSSQDFDIGGETVSVSSVQGLVKALQTNANANVIATPQILTLDNTEASFESGEKIPVPTTTTTTSGISTAGVTRESVSLSIKLKPQINKTSNFVKIDIETNIEDISTRELPQQVSTLAFATTSRSAKTSIVVADSDTVVLGGLIRDKTVDAVSKIPLLGDIPLLGWLFKSTTTSIEKTNLLLFITPQIIRHYDKAREILDNKLKKRAAFIDEFHGGDDPLEKYRDELINGLPDLDQINNYNSDKSVTIENDNGHENIDKEDDDSFADDMNDEESDYSEDTEEEDAEQSEVSEDTQDEDEEGDIDDDFDEEQASNTEEAIEE